MNFSCKELKRQARDTLNRRYGLPMEAFVVMQLIIFLILCPFQYSLQNNPNTQKAVIYYLAWMITFLLSGIFNGGLIRIHLSMARGKDVKFTDLFYYFGKTPDRLIQSQLLYLLMALGTAIPAIICAVPMARYDSLMWKVLFGIAVLAAVAGMCVLYLSFGFALYFLVDQEDLKVTHAFLESQNHMKGNLGRLLYMNLSFLGMYLLCFLSFGIGLLWISPYMAQTQTAFYRNLIKEVS